MDFRLGGRTLEALSPDGTVLWTHRFDRDVSEIPTRGPRLSFQFMDVDGDSETEIVAFVRFAQKGRPATISDGVFCFGREGKLHWSVIPDRTLMFGDRRYGPPWVIEDFVASDTPGSRRLWIAVSHATWWPSFVLEISSRGAAHVRYVQAGRIFSLAHWITSAGGVLAVGGVLQEQSEAALALLQDADPAASFPSPGTGLYECGNCPRVSPRRVFVFSSGADARLFSERHPLVRNINVSGSELKVNLDTGIRPPGMHAVVMIGPDQVPRSVRLTDAYWRVHRELEQAKQIHHTMEECPDRNRARIVREWTSAGWRELHVAGEPSSE